MVIPGVIPSAQPRGPARPRRPERGAALVEFALVSLVLYLLLAGAIEFGRLMFDANALQDVARVAARELAVAPVRAEATFDYALSCDAASDPGCLVDLRARIFDPACLVVDLNDPAVAFDPDGYFAAMPVVNRALRSLMITEPSRPGVLRYAGALLSDSAGAACSAIGPGGQAAPTGLTVGIPLVESRDAAGVEAIRWVPVVEEIRAAQDADCPSRGPFSLVYLANEDDVRAARRRSAGRPRPGGRADQLSVSGGDAQRISSRLRRTASIRCLPTSAASSRLMTAACSRTQRRAGRPARRRGRGPVLGAVRSRPAVRAGRPNASSVSQIDFGAGDLPARGSPMSIYRREVVQ